MLIFEWENKGMACDLTSVTFIKRSIQFCITRVYVAQGYSSQSVLESFETILLVALSPKTENQMQRKTV